MLAVSPIPAESFLFSLSFLYLPNNRVGISHPPPTRQRLGGPPRTCLPSKALIVIGTRHAWKATPLTCVSSSLHSHTCMRVVWEADFSDRLVLVVCLIELHLHTCTLVFFCSACVWCERQGVDTHLYGWGVLEWTTLFTHVHFGFLLFCMRVMWKARRSDTLFLVWVSWSIWEPAAAAPQSAKSEPAVWNKNGTACTLLKRA